MDQAARPIQSYVYDARSKILYWETEGHFVSKGGFDDVENVKQYLGNFAFYLAEVALRGMRVAHSTSTGGSAEAELLTRYFQWLRRAPCPGQSSGGWDYNKECLLPLGHAGRHKHGSVDWGHLIPAPDQAGQTSGVMLFIETQVGPAAGGQDWLVSRCVDQRWTAYFTFAADDREIDQLVSRHGYADWAVRRRSGKIYCTNAAHLNVHALLDREWQAWTHPCDPAPVTHAHCMVPHATSNGPCMNPSGHKGPHRAMNGFEWPRAGTLLPITDPDPRPAPEGLCSFCAEGPASHWGFGSSDWKVCASEACSHAHNFHEGRCAAGSVDTPETRAESLRYARLWRLDQAEEDAQKKPEGSCAFCVTPAADKHPECLVAVCGKHEREGWRLTHRLDLGGVCDTPQLREEVLRHVAASDASLLDGKREAFGARTQRDFSNQMTRLPGPHPSLTERQQEKSPPEEIPLVGTTPHYEWP